ncbi:MAG: PilN domain-containing protein [Kiritimatiellae bacterium]|nr:PilN domain-containing protein [Kiritimatiellia bacterium]
MRGIRLSESGRQHQISQSETWEISGAPPSEGAEAPSEVAEEAVAPQEFESRLGDALFAAAKTFDTHEFVLSLPLSKLLVDVVRVPVDQRDELPTLAQEALKRISPFPDEVYRVGVEIVAETDTEIVAVVSALPDAISLELGDALEDAKVRIVRTDSTALGRLRTLWPKIVSGGSVGRRLVLMDLDDGWDFIVLDDDAPVVLRGLGELKNAAELGREVMLGLIRAENMAGARDLGEIVVVTAQEGLDDEMRTRLATFGTVRLEVVAADEAYAGVEGVANRTVEAATFDVTPEAWDTALKESRFKKRLVGSLSVAGGIWLLVMGVLWGVPCYFNWMTARQDAMSKAHKKAYTEVANMRARVRLVQRYSDHACGALEMLKAFSDRMPEGVTLSQLTYKRGEGVRISAEAVQPDNAYAFKDALAKTERERIALDGEAAEDEESERMFADVILSEVKQSRGGVNRFDIEAKFPVEEDASSSAKASAKGGR